MYYDFSKGMEDVIAKEVPSFYELQEVHIIALLAEKFLYEVSNQAEFGGVLDLGVWFKVERMVPSFDGKEFHGDTCFLKQHVHPLRILNRDCTVQRAVRKQSWRPVRAHAELRKEPVVTTRNDVLEPSGQLIVVWEILTLHRAS